MDLNVRDRILLLALLPIEGTLDTIKIVKDLRSDLSFSEEEHKELGLQRSESGTYTWNEDEPHLKSIDIGDKGKEIISDVLKELSTSEKVTISHIDLYEKFGVEL